jgi:hypothetical protein
MNPELTQAQRRAIDEHGGQPVYIVDTDRHETFVLLTSSDFERVRLILGYKRDDDPWTDDKNRRRVELIDKRIAGTISDDELVELMELQQQAETYFDQVAPPPMKGIRGLHRQLLNSRGSQQ